jgi:myo-inositol-1(or 4)-monophosphatase
LSHDLELAERAARVAGEMLLTYFGRPPEGLERKSSRNDPVSDADREAERVIVDLLAAEHPGDGLLAEEGSSREGSNGRRWIVDPLDGTVNFLYGRPCWAVSIALEDAEGMVAGVVHDPTHGETFRAARGEGAELNGSPLRVRTPRNLDRALVGTGFGYDHERRIAQGALVARLLPLVRDIRRTGAAALDLSWLAAGRLDGYFEHGLNPWDWAAGRLIAEEAGATVVELPGDPAGLAVASTPELAATLAEIARTL